MGRPGRRRRRRQWERRSRRRTGWILRLWNAVTPFHPTTASKVLVTCPSRLRDLVSSWTGHGRVVDDWLIRLTEYVIRVRKGASREIVAVHEVELVSRRVGKGATHFHGRFNSIHGTLGVRLRAIDGNILYLHIVPGPECRLNCRELRLKRGKSLCLSARCP